MRLGEKKGDGMRSREEKGQGEAGEEKGNGTRSGEKKGERGHEESWQ